MDDNKNKTSRMGYNIAKRIAVVAAVFAAILSILMIANYIQTKAVDPLNSKAISQLMEQLQENPNDTTLKEQIRALDLLARKAYFTHQWQLRTGSYLLFAFVLVLLLSLKYMSSLESKLPDLSESPVRMRPGRTGYCRDDILFSVEWVFLSRHLFSASYHRAN